MVHASLFSGIGGPEVAAEMLGWENAFHCEINPFGKAVLDHWFPESKSYEDITKTSFKEWRGKIDVLTGGFPCQPFSYAGKRGGAGDDRYLWPEMLRAINEIRPAWVVGENVVGITTMVEGGICTDMGCDSSLFSEGDRLHRYQATFTFTIERVCRDLEGIGYSVQPMLIPAAGVNAPHRRDRVFIIANTEETGCSLLPTPTAGEGEHYRLKYKPGSQMGTSISAMAAAGLLPTPQTSDAKSPLTPEQKKAYVEKWKQKGITPSASYQLRQMAFEGILPTPRTCSAMAATLDTEGNLKGERFRNLETIIGRKVCSQMKNGNTKKMGIGYRLSPLFTEEMMGFPFGWTTFPFLSQDGGLNPSKPTETQ